LEFDRYVITRKYYLLMCKRQLVLENKVPIREKLASRLADEPRLCGIRDYLDFVGKDAEIISQDSNEFLITEVIVWHVAQRRKVRLREPMGRVGGDRKEC
jgi:hypothetical protein